LCRAGYTLGIAMHFQFGYNLLICTMKVVTFLHSGGGGDVFRVLGAISRAAYHHQLCGRRRLDAWPHRASTRSLSCIRYVLRPDFVLGRIACTQWVDAANIHHTTPTYIFFTSLLHYTIYFWLLIVFYRYCMCSLLFFYCAIWSYDH